MLRHVRIDAVLYAITGEPFHLLGVCAANEQEKEGKEGTEVGGHGYWTRKVNGTLLAGLYLLPETRSNGSSTIPTVHVARSKSEHSLLDGSVMWHAISMTC